ncbi:MAG TPA: glycosyltransferase family 4 protein [Verrucomicrobiae bacterium]|nr:glycosyltransferase family 4 protein [Verrucomicrobiae bacterium]
MLNEQGGIQQFAKEQRKFLSKSYSIKMSDWYSPTRLRDELVYRKLPGALSRRVFEHRHHGDFNGVLMAPALERYDLVHYWLVDAAMAYPNKPGIISCYGIEILTSYVRHHRKKKFLDALSNAVAIQACSNFTKEYLVANYAINPRKITVINPGIDLEVFKFNKKPANDKIHIGTLTRFVKRKNVPSIIKALKILQEQYSTRFVYYLAGDGPERKRILSELKRAGIEHRYFGRISEADKLKAFYPLLDLFVLPSLQTATDVEGFGIVFLEANATGVPVVAANTGGISDAVKSGISGEFADPTSPEDIAKKMHQILNSDKDYRNLARQWAERFSQKNTAMQFQNLYERVARQPK